MIENESLTQEIVRLYQGGKSLERVHWATGLNVPRIRRILKEEGVAIRDRGPVVEASRGKTNKELEQERLNVIERYQSGESIDHIRSQLLYPAYIIKRWLREAGITLGKRGRPIKLTDEKIAHVKRLALEGCPVVEISFELKISVGSVYNALRKLELNAKDIRDEKRHEEQSRIGWGNELSWRP